MGHTVAMVANSLCLCAGVCIISWYHYFIRDLVKYPSIVLVTGGQDSGQDLFSLFNTSDRLRELQSLEKRGNLAGKKVSKGYQEGIREMVVKAFERREWCRRFRFGTALLNFVSSLKLRG